MTSYSVCRQLPFTSAVDHGHNTTRKQVTISRWWLGFRSPSSFLYSPFPSYQAEEGEWDCKDPDKCIQGSSWSEFEMFHCLFSHAAPLFDSIRTLCACVCMCVCTCACVCVCMEKESCNHVLISNSSMETKKGEYIIAHPHITELLCVHTSSQSCDRARFRD